MSSRFNAATVCPLSDTDTSVRMISGENVCDLVVSGGKVHWRNNPPSVADDGHEPYAVKIKAIRERAICDAVAVELVDHWAKEHAREPMFLTNEIDGTAPIAEPTNEWVIFTTLQPGPGHSTIVRGFMGKTEDCDLVVFENEVEWKGAPPQTEAQRRACEEIAIELAKHWKSKYSPKNKIAGNDFYIHIKNRAAFDLFWGDFPGFTSTGHDPDNYVDGGAGHIRRRNRTAPAIVAPRFRAINLNGR